MHLELFRALEAWEVAVGPDKVAANVRMTDIALRLLPVPALTRQRFLSFVEAECIDPGSYCLGGGHPSETYTLDDRRSEWVVYYSERGLESGVVSFGSESEALQHLLDLLVRDATTRMRL